MEARKACVIAILRMITYKEFAKVTEVISKAIVIPTPGMIFYARLFVLNVLIIIS